jgi:hypothetical protein
LYAKNAIATAIKAIKKPEKNKNKINLKKKIKVEVIFFCFYPKRIHQL